MSEPLWRWPAHRLTAAIRAGAVSAREAAMSALDRVQAVNPVLNAIVDLLPDEALAAADAADAARLRGDALGPLHGVPVTVKSTSTCAAAPPPTAWSPSRTTSPPTTARWWSTCAGPAR